MHFTLRWGLGAPLFKPEGKSVHYINVERAARVTTITFNRPEVLNSINRNMHFELQQAFDEFSQDPEQLICVVTGTGDKAFCAGRDLKAAVAAVVLS